MPISDYYTTVSDKNNDEIDGLLDTAALLDLTYSGVFRNWTKGGHIEGAWGMEVLQHRQEAERFLESVHVIQ